MNKNRIALAATAFGLAIVGAITTKGSTKVFFRSAFTAACTSKTTSCTNANTHTCTAQGVKLYTHQVSTSVCNNTLKTGS
jgi:hypothetical protein